MSTIAFDYQVRTREGRLIAGQLEADNLPAVAQRLREMGYTPIGIVRAPRLGLQTEIRIPWLTDRVRLKDVAVMTRQLATMVSSGLTLVRALSVLIEQIASAPLRVAVVEIRKDVEGGSSLSAALARHPRIFDATYAAMIQAAEASGQLDEVLSRLASMIERRVALRTKVRSAMTYPLVMVFVVVVVVAAMMIFVVPTFARLYGQFHSRLPLPTRIVVGFSHVLASLWLLLLVALIAAATYGLRRWSRTESGRRALDTAKLRLPIFGALAHKVALERFASMLASLLTTGVGILESLDLAADNAGNVVVADAAHCAQAAVREGRSLGSSMAESTVIPTMFTQMVETGEESSAVAEMLEKVAAFYRNEVESTVNSLTTLLEPLIVVVMGIVIGAIVVSLYLPMFKYITLVGNSQ